MALLDDYIKDLAPLVNLDCGTCNTAGVTRAAEIMKGYFESIGFTCELIDLGPKAGRGLLARNKPHADHYDVLLNGHFDTVLPTALPPRAPSPLTATLRMARAARTARAAFWRPITPAKRRVRRT